MNRIHASLGAVFVAASMVSVGALAADDATKQGKSATNKADKTQVVPSRDDLQPGAAPSVQRMDDNVQRQHDRDRGSGATAAGGAATGTNAGRTASADAKDVRDWDAIDKNNDNLIGPEEMEEALKATGPQAKPQQPRS
jgi:hypothetical protein